MKTNTVSKWTTALALTAGGALLATSALAQSSAGSSPTTSPGADTKSSTSQPATGNSPSAPGATTGSTGSEQKSGEMKSGEMKSGAMKSGTSRDSAQGANREQVKAVQQALKDKGHDPGDVDGAMGPKTQAALRDFQQKEGLKATGLADSDTMAKLAVAANTTAPAASPSGGSPSGTPSSTGASKDAPSTGAKQSK